MNAWTRWRLRRAVRVLESYLRGEPRRHFTLSQAGRHLYVRDEKGRLVNPPEGCRTNV